jgi:hypothetical protein
VEAPDEPPLGHPLPRAREAYIDPRKLRDYSLDPENPGGRHKAVVFRSALGIAKGDWRYLHGAILEALAEHRVSSVRNAWAPRRLPTYGVVIPIAGLNGRTRLVITAWKMIGGRPELTSARVAKTRDQPEDG